MAYKLLLADDSITIQKVVELVLAEENFQIKSVSNGEDAVNLLATFEPDIVLADIEMPRLNGYQVCEKIKNNPSTSHVPVILLAGAFEPIDEELARQAGADDSVIKPFESQELISKINAALTMASAEGAQAVPSEDDEALEAIEEEDIFADLQDTVAEPSAAVSAKEIDEDLWSMEEIPEVAEAGAEAEVFEEAFEVKGEELPLRPEIKPTPVMQSQAIQSAAGLTAMTEAAMPSKEEMLSRFEKVVDVQVASLLSELDIKKALLASLMPSMKDAVEKVLWEVAPELAEKVLKEILKSSVSSLTTEVEKVIWETVPDLANTMISREIEKIKSEF